MKRCTAERDKTLNDLCSQPKKETDIATVQEKEINIDNFKNFHAKRRWKVSQKEGKLKNISTAVLHTVCLDNRSKL